jgi:hypothetical protein
MGRHFTAKGINSNERSRQVRIGPKLISKSQRYGGLKPKMEDFITR